MITNTILLDNATLRSAFTSLHLLPFDYDGENAIQIFDLHLMGASVLIDSILLHDHIFVPNLHGEEYPPTLQIASSILGSDLFTPLELHKAELDSVYEVAKDDFQKWPVASSKLMSYLDDAIGIKPFNVNSWDREIHGRYSTRLLSHVVSTNSLSKIYTGGATNIPKQFILLLENQGTKSNNPPHIPELSDSDLSREEINRTVLWLAYRTCVYDIISCLRNIPYVPYPARSELWKYINHRRSAPHTPFELPLDGLLKTRFDIGHTVNETLGAKLYQLTIPPFLSYVLFLAANPSDIFPIVLELRNDCKVKALRDCLSEISSEVRRNSSIKKVMKLRNDFEHLSDTVMVDFYGKDPHPVSVSLQLASFGISSEIPIPVQIAGAFGGIEMINKPHLAFLRDVYRSIMDIWNFSSLYDKVFFSSPKITRTILTQKKEYPSVDLLREKARSYLRKKGNKVSIIIFDIKNFDSINFRYGREGGDEVLNLLGTILDGLPGRKTMVSLAAGDSYVVLLLGVTGDKAHTLADNIREALLSQPLSLLVKSETGSIKEAVQADIYISISSAVKADDIDRCFSAALKRLKTQ